MSRFAYQQKRGLFANVVCLHSNIQSQFAY